MFLREPFADLSWASMVLGCGWQVFLLTRVEICSMYHYVVLMPTPLVVSWASMRAWPHLVLFFEHREFPPIHRCCSVLSVMYALLIAYGHRFSDRCWHWASWMLCLPFVLRDISLVVICLCDSHWTVTIGCWLCMRLHLRWEMFDWCHISVDDWDAQYFDAQWLWLCRCVGCMRHSRVGLCGLGFAVLALWIALCTVDCGTVLVVIAVFATICWGSSEVLLSWGILMWDPFGDTGVERSLKHPLGIDYVWTWGVSDSLTLLGQPRVVAYAIPIRLALLYAGFGHLFVGWFFGLFWAFTAVMLSDFR